MNKSVGIDANPVQPWKVPKKLVTNVLVSNKLSGIDVNPVQDSKVKLKY